MFNFKDPFSSLRDGENFNGVTAMIMQEDENFNKAKNFLENYYSIRHCENIKELEDILFKKLNIQLQELSYEHQKYLIYRFIGRNIV